LVRLFLKRQSEIILVVPPPRETPGDFSAKMRAVVDAATPVPDLRWHGPRVLRIRKKATC
jgi:hypothetical protein